jgi:hypothetical protein
VKEIEVFEITNFQGSEDDMIELCGGFDDLFE